MKNPPINWKYPLAIFGILALVCAVGVPLVYTLNERAKKREVITYLVPDPYKALLPHKRRIDASALPADVQEWVKPALALINKAPAAHNLAARFLLATASNDAVDAITVKLVPHTGDTCNRPNEDLGWLDIQGGGFEVKLCVEKARTMLRLRGDLLLSSPMARRFQSYDQPWKCLLAHEIMHTDLPQHTNQAGLMYRPPTDTKDDHRPRDCQLSAHEINLWGAVVKPYILSLEFGSSPL